MGITFVAYSPLSRGILTGTARKLSDIPETDLRRVFLPRLHADVFDENFKLVEAVEKIALVKRVTVAQVALAWVRYQGAVPIPSSTTVKRLVENTELVELNPTEVEDIKEILGRFVIKGGRYPPQMEKFLTQ